MKITIDIEWKDIMGIMTLDAGQYKARFWTMMPNDCTIMAIVETTNNNGETTNTTTQCFSDSQQAKAWCETYIADRLYNHPLCHIVPSLKDFDINENTQTQTYQKELAIFWRSVSGIEPILLTRLFRATISHWMKTGVC